MGTERELKGKRREGRRGRFKKFCLNAFRREEGKGRNLKKSSFATFRIAAAVASASLFEKAEWSPLLNRPQRAKEGGSDVVVVVVMTRKVPRETEEGRRVLQWRLAAFASELALRFALAINK